jgi:rubrerythrin
MIPVGSTENGAERGRMLDETRSLGQGAEEYVEFFSAGSADPGEYRCASCGYGVTVQSTLPRCPMCAGTSWEQGVWFSVADRARAQ